MPIPMTLAVIAPDGTVSYLRDDPDGVPPQRTADPFEARAFVDAQAISDWIDSLPPAHRARVDRPGVLIVPWPIDLDRAWIWTGPVEMPAPVPLRPKSRSKR